MARLVEVREVRRVALGAERAGGDEAARTVGMEAAAVLRAAWEAVTRGWVAATRAAAAKEAAEPVGVTKVGVADLAGKTGVAAPVAPRAGSAI